MTGVSPAPAPNRFLGAYLLALCFYVSGIYRWPGGPPFILDPRSGIAVLLDTQFSLDNYVIYRVEWVFAAWLIFLATLIFFTGKLVKVYLISEVILAIPTAYYIGALVVGRGGHFAPGFEDLIATFLLFVVFSIVPMGLAWRSLRPPR
jgi:hypothetical protein